MVKRLGCSLVLVAAVLILPASVNAQPAASTPNAGSAPMATSASSESNADSTPLASDDASNDDQSADSAAAKDQARLLFARGLEHFQAGRYKDAIDEFLAAHRVFPNPVLSFNAALAYEKMGDSAGALRFYREYLRQEPDAGDRPQVEQQIGVLERRLQDKGLQQVTILSVPDGATVRIDDRPVGVTPWTGELNPGRHALRLRLEGYQDAEQRFELLAHRSLDVAVTLDERVAAPPAAATAPGPASPAAGATPSPTAPLPTDDQRPRVRPPTLVALGAGVATLGAAGVFEGLRRSSENDVREEDTQVARHDAFDQMESRQTTARILAGVGAAVTVAGGVLLTIDLTRQRDEQTAALQCGFRGCLVRGRF